MDVSVKGPEENGPLRKIFITHLQTKRDDYYGLVSVGGPAFGEIILLSHCSD